MSLAKGPSQLRPWLVTTQSKTTLTPTALVPAYAWNLSFRISFDEKPYLSNQNSAPVPAYAWNLSIRMNLDQKPYLSNPNSTPVKASPEFPSMYNHDQGWTPQNFWLRLAAWFFKFNPTYQSTPWRQRLPISKDCPLIQCFADKATSSNLSDPEPHSDYWVILPLPWTVP